MDKQSNQVREVFDELVERSDSNEHFSFKLGEKLSKPQHRGRRYIAVAGNIGVGKSTLVEFLSKTFGLRPVFEPYLDNPYLEDFYKDMKRWAFHSQIYFLAKKFQLHKELESYRESIVLDRTIYEDAEIFAQYLYKSDYIEERDFQTYWKLYNTIKASLKPPDLLIYLRADLKTIVKRIKLRGRPMERKIPKNYLRQLNQLYEDWFQGYNLSPTLVITTNKIDYITDLVDRIDILKEIEGHLYR